MGLAIQALKNLLLTAAFLVLRTANEQPEVEWSRTYTYVGGYTYGCTAMQQTTDGGYVLAGPINGDAWLVRTDSIGNEGWNRVIIAGNNDGIGFHAVQQTTDGGYALAGQTFSGWGTGDYDMWLAKTDFLGNEEWSRAIGGTSSDGCFAIKQTADGGYALAGYTYSGLDSGAYDMWLVKTDAEGNQEWSRAFGGASTERCYTMRQTTDGGFVLAGYTTSFGAGYADMWLVKTDASGNLQWSRTYGGTAQDYCYAVQQTADGGYALAGYTRPFGAGNADISLVKTDESGNLQWSRTYGGASWDDCSALRQTADGGYALAGSNGLVKTDSAGNEESNSAYGGTFYALQLTSNGGYVLAGSTDEGDMLLVKTTPERAFEHTPKPYRHGEPDTLRCGLVGVPQDEVEAVTVTLYYRSRDDVYSSQTMTMDSVYNNGRQSYLGILPPSHTELDSIDYYIEATDSSGVLARSPALPDLHRVWPYWQLTKQLPNEMRDDFIPARHGWNFANTGSIIWNHNYNADLYPNISDRCDN
ncbi:MAG: hypothetical protein IPK53_04050 [bacterium]|nr:hypothetical protein [bacterium]